MNKMMIALVFVFALLFLMIFLLISSVENAVSGYDLARVAADNSYIEIYVDSMKVA